MLSDVIRGRRAFERIDGKTAAEQIGISQGTLSRIERGGDPDLSTLRTVCKWLRIAPSVFIDSMDDGAPAAVDLVGEPVADALADGPTADLMN